MLKHEDIVSRNSKDSYKSTNVNIVNLLKKTKDEKTKEKKQNLYIAAAAVSILAISGFVISQ
jgi:hypothetical protein|tara:strand:- start:613 stop:798 length:186 start_codon:yes stop_codon:yes gene_type:complete